jgi:FKBP-type peptidyl-prolyl cis-trans isomerase
MTGKDPLTLKSLPLFLLLLTMLLLVSCMNSGDSKEKPQPPGLKESLIKANKEAVITETGQINDFLMRYRWDVTETGSGLRYWIYEKGTGLQVEHGDLVEAEYVISLLNGDTAYTSDKDGPMVFIPGNAQVISGLEEGILLLKQGDRAKFIIPSHLAYGLIGDQDKIGKKTTLVYDIKVLRIKKEETL